MNHATRFAKLALLLAMVCALALTGCGSDGLSAADQARIDDAEAAAAAAAAEQAAAEEAARLAAEEAAAAEAEAAAAAEQAAAEEAARLAAEAAAQAEMDRMARIEAARMAIAAAATPEAARAAYAGVEDEATATESAALMQAVADRTAALATMDRMTAQKSALSAAAANVDVTAFDLTTNAGITVAEGAIAALQAALDAATDVSDADKAMYQLQLDAASAPVMAARAESGRMARIADAMQVIAMADTPEAAQAAFDMVKDDATVTEGVALQGAVDARIAELATMDRATAQKMALSTAAGNIDLSDLSTQAAVNAAGTAIAALETALAAAVDVSDADKDMYQSTVDGAKTAVMTAQGVLDHTAQTMALASAVSALQAIDLSSLATQAAIDAAQAAVDTLRAALEAATELSAAEKSAAMAELAAASRTVMLAQDRVNMGSQVAALAVAVGALEEINLGALMTEAQIAAAEAAIVAVDAALAAATDLTDAQKLEATVAVTLAKRSVTAAKSALASNIEAQTTALSTTATALGAIDLTDLSDQAAVNAAQRAVNALKAALAAATHVSEADKATYQATVTTAETAVMTAQSALDHTAQSTVLANAVNALKALDLSSLTTQAAITAAETAIADLQAALDAATELSAAEKSAAMIELGAARRIVLAAQGRFDVNSQKMALRDAADTLGDIDLNNLMTQDDIDAADTAIVALELALAAATGLTDAEKLDATVAVTLAKRRVVAAQADLDGNVGDQRMALNNAAIALDDLGLTDVADDIDPDTALDTADKIVAAQEALDDLKAALDGATHLSDDEKAGYQGHYDTVAEAVRTADSGMDRAGRMMTQRTALTNTMADARKYVGMVNDTASDADVDAADKAIAALEKAIADAVDLPDGGTDVAIARGTLTTLKGLLANARKNRMMAMQKQDEEDMKAATARGKALYAALAGNAEGDTTALDNIDTGTTPLALSATSITIDAAAGAGALPDTGDGSNPDAVVLEAGDSAVMALDSWDGMDYAHTNPGTKVMNEARVYNNKGPAETQPFSGTGGKYTLVSGQTGTEAVQNGYLLGSDGTTILDVSALAANLALVGGADFEHSGTESRPYDAEVDAAYTTRGTYDGAPGLYRCTGACTVTNDGKGSPSAMGGTWWFKPDVGAMVSTPDGHYLYYGWWVSKDADGDPTAASAFAGSVGTVTPAWSGAYSATEGSETITGSAIYNGAAAGKFALNNPVAGTGDGGHFTADAILSAKFSGDDPGVTGMIDNFRLNDGSDDPGWSVSLARGTFGSDGGITAPSSGPTVWSINGNKASASGTWSGTMYDEMPGDAPDGDGSNIPTTVIGTFYSEFGEIGRVVGGFGADKQDKQ